ncbi:unnamed protein product [Ectocarpus sp. 12 AP-2014]
MNSFVVLFKTYGRWAHRKRSTWVKRNTLNRVDCALVPKASKISVPNDATFPNKLKNRDVRNQFAERVIFGGEIAPALRNLIYKSQSGTRRTGELYSELWDWGLGGVVSERRGGDYWDWTRSQDVHTAQRSVVRSAC